MTPEQAARLFVKTLVEKGCEVGLAIHNAQARLWAVEVSLEEPDYTNGLVFAGEKKWLDNEGHDGTFILTQAGYTIGSTDA